MSWIDTYLSYTSSQESPTEFHLFGGIATIAAVLNRNVWLPRSTRDGIERYRIYPGQAAVVLVADSGFLRKTTAVDIAAGFMKKANVRLFDGKISHEKLLTKLGSFKDGKAVLTVVAGELETFLSRATYHEGIIGTLMKLFDAKDDSYDTQKGGNIELKNVSLTILAATNPKSIGNVLPPETKEQGFQSRWLFVYADHTDKMPDPLTTQNGAVDPVKRRMIFEQHTELIEGLRRLASLRGEFKLDDAARLWYDTWYHHYATNGGSSQPGWASRRGDHLTRLAMILEASSTYGTVITQKSFEAADKLLTNYIEAHFHKTFSHIGRSANAELQERVLDIFRLHPLGKPVVLSDILYRTRRYFKSFNELNETLLLLQKASILRLNGMNRAGEEEWIMLRDD